jgi:hypothetical protein
MVMEVLLLHNMVILGRIHSSSNALYADSKQCTSQLSCACDASLRAERSTRLKLLWYFTDGVPVPYHFACTVPL